MAGATRFWYRKSPEGREIESSFATRRLKTSISQLISIWVPFSNQGKIRQQKEKDDSSFHLPKLSLRLLGSGKPIPLFIIGCCSYLVFLYRYSKSKTRKFFICHVYGYTSIVTKGYNFFDCLYTSFDIKPSLNGVCFLKKIIWKQTLSF